MAFKLAGALRQGADVRILVFLGIERLRIVCLTY